MVMKRRGFVQWLGLGWLATALPGCFTKLQASLPATSTSTLAPGSQSLAQSAATAYVPVGSVSELDQAGFLLNQRTPLGSVMVVRDRANAPQAVNPACPHAGCTVNWEADSAEFVCPCHGARFAADGAVQRGPARTDLVAYNSRIDNGTVWVAPTASQPAPGQAPTPSDAEADRDDYDDDHGEVEDDDDRDHREHGDDERERHGRSEG